MDWSPHLYGGRRGRPRELRGEPPSLSCSLSSLSPPPTSHLPPAPQAAASEPLPRASGSGFGPYGACPYELSWLSGVGGITLSPSLSPWGSLSTSWGPPILQVLELAAATPPTSFSALKGKIFMVLPSAPRRLRDKRHCLSICLGWLRPGLWGLFLGLGNFSLRLCLSRISQVWVLDCLSISLYCILCVHVFYHHTHTWCLWGPDGRGC